MPEPSHVLAASLNIADKVNQFGAYAGLAAIVGLAVLSLLYFSQARELKRLRDWAGRAPERAAELEEAATRAAQQRISASVTPATVVASRLAPHPQSAAAPPQGAAAAPPAAAPSSPVVPAPASPLTPAAAAQAKAAASSAAGGAGAAAPSGQQLVPPGPETPGAVGAKGGQPSAPAGPAPVAGPAAQPPTVPPVVPAEQGAAPPSPIAPQRPKSTMPGGATPIDPATTQAPAVPQAPRPPHSPAPVAPPAPARPAQPLRQPGPPIAYRPQSARARADAAQRELGVLRRSPIAGILSIVAIIVVAAAIGFLLTRVFAGSDEPPAPNTVATTPTTARNSTRTAEGNAPVVVRSRVRVVVLNGTQTQGLAEVESGRVTAAGFKVGGKGNNTDQTLVNTTIYFADTYRAAADEVAGVLGVPQASVRPLQQGTRTVAISTGEQDPNVVVVVGADRASQ